ALVVYNADEVPRPAIVPAGATLTAEACGVGNGALDPGEMVTVDLPLRNVGLLDTNQLVATLEASGGVTSPSGPQNYGQLQVGAPPVSRSFSFVAEGVCGGEVIATLSLDDGGVAIGPVQFVFDLGLQVPSGLETTLSNTALIGIPIGGPADPYPSTIEVSGLTGRVGNVTVTLSGVSHPFPDDIDVLLVAPDGRSVVLMSDAGGGFALQNANITFDDGAAAAIPDGSAIVTGTYRPANYEGQSDEFLAPAPSGPYGSALADLSGADPNGTWRLYIIDDFFLDGGILSAGWSLTFDRNVPVCCGGIPGFQVSPGEITTTEAGGTATFTLALSSMPSAEVSIGLASSDPTEGLVSPVELVFDPNDAQLPKIVTVTGVDDTLIDGDVTFTIVTSPAVTSDSDYAGLDPPDISVVNLNDDFTSMTIGDVGLVEGNTGTTSFVFPVTLTAPSEAEVSVGYATQDDTATAGSDYQAISGTLIFPPGTLVRMIPVSVTGDTAFEGDERFFVDLTGAVGADILDGRGVGTILNDDAPTLSVSATSVALGGSVQVTLSDGPGNRTDWVALAKVGSPLTSYSDWQYLNGTHSVPTTGLTSAVLTFNMPRTLGDYEFRFFANNGYTLLATSPAVSLRPPTLTSSAASVGPGGSVQVSVAEGPGYRGDWVALSAVGSPTTSYLDWKYLNGTRSMPATGVTSATLTFVMPQPLGNYVFRFFANNGNTLLATSPVVTVELPSTPILEVVPASLSFGTVATNSSAEQVVTVRNIGAGTLVGQASVTGAGFSLVGSSSYSLGAGESAPLTVRFAPLVEGAAIGTLSLTGAGGATVPLDGTGEQPSTTPVLEVDPSSLSFGSVGLGASADLPITVRNAGAGVLTGNASVTGSGFLLVGVSSYSLGPGEATSVTVRFTPMSAGDATGTLSLTGGNGATVPLSGSGTQGPSVAVSTTSVALGAPVQVTVSEGPGNRTDWVALAKVGSPLSSYSDWQYLSGTRSVPATGLTSAVLTFVMPRTLGDYEFRFFANNSYTLLAASPVVSLRPPTLTLSTTSVEPGGSVQVSVAEGPGYRGDWVSLSLVGSASTSYVDWKYLSGTRSMPATGVTSAVLTFVMPQTPGTYEFRFFANNGYTLLAKSPAVVVSVGTD
ncbi:MAG TPA: Calx-beta domain-containing protein, partial [Vicinamibacteria bacterium]|nr:Calx-beta domain-containing protein [Vicinamibacteria bacterium]